MKSSIMEICVWIYYLTIPMLIRVSQWLIVNKKEYFEFMSDLQDWEYEIKKYKRTRSTDQNRYYRWLLGIVEKETWIPTEETHEKMRMKFLYIPENWVQLWYCKSTAKLNTTEFTEYIENIKNFMAQYSIILPSTEQYENNQ